MSDNFKTKGKVLVVDDEVVLAETLRDMLVFHGYEAEIAHNGLQACKVLESGDVNLVISDIRMPMMDGMQLLKHINEKHKGVPVILISGFSDYDEASISDNGAKALLQKPMNVEDLLKRVESTLKVSNDVVGNKKS